ncbi:MAG: FecR family protein, partial [Pseudomonadota bacterium]
MADERARTVIEAEAGRTLELPGDPAFLTADYFRDGTDLVIETADGGQTVIAGYFELETPVDLAIAGAVLPGDMVGAMAQPRDPSPEIPAAPQPELEVAAAAPVEESAAAPGVLASEQVLGEPIGSIGELDGQAFVERGQDGVLVELKAGDPIYEDDVLSTGDGASVGVAFKDGMSFSLGANARMVLDEFSYDAASNEGGGLFSVLAGEFSFVSGAAAATAEDALMIETPTMTIGVRGTKVVSQIGEDGVARVALLAEEDGTVGKIMVQTDAGEQLIEEPNQLVEVSGRDAPPSAAREIASADVVALFGDALDALPAPKEFFTPKVDAPDPAPLSPFAAQTQAQREAQEAAVAAEAQEAVADSARSFSDRTDEVRAEAQGDAQSNAAGDAAEASGSGSAFAAPATALR